MADNERQTDDRKPSRKPDILRARDIIPGSDNPAPKAEGVSNTDIPRFDLAEDIMAEFRKQAAGRRKRPGTLQPADISPIPRPAPDLKTVGHPQSKYGFSNGFSTASDPIIANIVARDIERLCRGLLI